MYVRFRPPNSREKEEKKDKNVIEIQKPHSVFVSEPNRPEPHRFSFDYVFGPQTPQVALFEKAAKPLIENVFQGFNATIFAYGQTGSGKTYSMTGELKKKQLRGIIPRIMNICDDRMAGLDNKTELTLQMSYLEIYNEKIRDLLRPENNKKFEIQTTKNGIQVKNLTELWIGGSDEFIEMYEQANSHRKQAYVIYICSVFFIQMLF